MHSRTLGVLLPSLYHFGALPGRDVRSDADLVERFVRAGDQQAFAALVRRHGPMVLAACRRLLPDRHEAEDAFQATFLVLVRKSARLRQPEQLASWLHGVAYRTALRLRQRAARWQLVPGGSQLAASPEPAPLERVAWKEIQAVLDEEVQRLPSKYRLPVVLCYLQGQSYSAAARSLGWPAGTVAVRLARARQRLRTRFARRGLVFSATLLSGLLAQQALAAAVPGGLFMATLRVAYHAAAGSTGLAGMVSQPVITLAEGVLKAMCISKIKTTLLLALAVALVATGVSGVAWFRGAEARAQPPSSGTGGAKDTRLADEEREIKLLEQQLQERRARLDQLRHGDALNQIEAALRKLQKANATDAQRRAAVEDFARAFERLKAGLTGRRLPADSWMRPGPHLPWGTTAPEGGIKRKPADMSPVKQQVEGERGFALAGIVSNGKVLEVDREHKKVLLSAGSKDGVRKGRLFRVYQGAKAAPDQTGWLRVTEVAPRWSTATIVQEPNPRSPVQPGDILQVHDEEEPEGLGNDARRP
jgi:RNA polymerase sigma factor (sigma-70 family)